MARQIEHRGPDELGVHVDAGGGMSNCRLSIIDVAGGQQPIVSEDGAVRVVFNGEIYNHVQLRQDLQAAGHTMASQ
ncbi:MAG: asparagine synthetase B, partial [Gemmatimonadetes bacterium]|nr:asparagine synthetase B [Gemmatimonadota bacterium]